MLQPGDIIDGKYRIVRVLGSGGMGAVYEGHNVRVGKRVAVKVMQIAYSQDDQHIGRFIREAQAAARIGSAHIVDVFDMGELPSGDRFMVMEFLEGENLSSRLRKRPQFSPVSIATIGIQILEGLAKVHEAGIVHRDIKPANIFLSKLGASPDFVKILDFGICKLLQERRPGEVSTGVGDMLGTPSYMAPEQIELGSKIVDARSDVYAVGVILYRCVSGRLPYRVKAVPHLETIRLERAATILTDVVPDVDEEFAIIVERALAWDPNQRYSTAETFQRDLVQWLATVNRVDKRVKYRDSYHDESTENPVQGRRGSLPTFPDDGATRRVPGGAPDAVPKTTPSPTRGDASPPATAPMPIVEEPSITDIDIEIDDEAITLPHIRTPRKSS